MRELMRVNLKYEPFFPGGYRNTWTKGMEQPAAVVSYWFYKTDFPSNQIGLFSLENFGHRIILLVILETRNPGFACQKSRWLLIGGG